MAQIETVSKVIVPDKKGIIEALLETLLLNDIVSLLKKLKQKAFFNGKCAANKADQYDQDPKQSLVYLNSAYKWYNMAYQLEQELLSLNYPGSLDTSYCHTRLQEVVQKRDMVTAKLAFQEMTDQISLNKATCFPQEKDVFATSKPSQMLTQFHDYSVVSSKPNSSTKPLKGPKAAVVRF